MSFLPRQENKKCFIACDEFKVKNGLCDCVNRMKNKQLKNKYMLTAEQLRINNYVHYNGMNLPISSIKSPKPLKDKRHSDKWIIELFDGASTIDCVINDIKPIELTEEWLLKMGFQFPESEFESEIIVNKESRFSAIKAKGFYSVGLAGSFGLFLIKLKYVHEVQNLYHSVFGEELTIK